MYRTILAPLDGSENAERILPWLEPLRGTGSALRLLRIVPHAAPSAGSFERTLVIEAESYLGSTARRGALGRLVVGAVAEKVIALGAVPVLVVPRGPRENRT